jgi:hypothetical protein
MPNINRQITLTSKGTNSGPLYDVFYSLDCINYTLCIDGSNVSLPNIGSTAIITLPDNTECLKLVNLTIGCGSNSEIQIINPTTTTTTTAAPTTTTTSTTTTAAPSGSATLAWSYSETGGANGTMDLYVNGFAVESRSSTASGTRTVYVGDTIYVELQIVTPCGSPDTYANVYTTGNVFNDANCANNAGVSLTTGTRTVVSGDIGSTLTINTFAACDGACL